MRYSLFKKNDLFVNSISLWELMQPIGSSGTHNYHNITPLEIVNVLNSLEIPFCIYKVKNGRHAIIPIFNKNSNSGWVVIIETNAGLINRPSANINKLITIYPISNLTKYIEKNG